MKTNIYGEFHPDLVSAGKEAITKLFPEYSNLPWDHQIKILGNFIADCLFNTGCNCAAIIHRLDFEELCSLKRTTPNQGETTMTQINEFAGDLYRNRTAMLQAIAEGWVSGHGTNSVAHQREIFAKDSDEKLAAEAIEEWFSEPMCEDEESEDYDRAAIANRPNMAELVAAFADLRDEMTDA